MGLFDRLEAGLERAVQGTFAKHLRSAVHPVEIASHIRRAMDDRAVTSSGRAIVPNVFTIELSPSDYDRLHPDLQNVEMDLVAAAEEHCDGQHYQPAGPIDIIFEEHADLETGVFRIRPSKASRPRATGNTGQERALRPASSRASSRMPVPTARSRLPVPAASGPGRPAPPGSRGSRRLAAGQPAPRARRARRDGTASGPARPGAAQAGQPGRPALARRRRRALPADGRDHHPRAATTAPTSSSTTPASPGGTASCG